MPRGPETTRLIAALPKARHVSSDFDLNPDVAPEGGPALRPAGVLIALWQDRVYLTKRSSHLKHHPGQVAFPGGKVDPGDVTPEAAALREAGEEIGLPADAVRLLGRLPDHRTVTGFSVTPVVAEITTRFNPVPEAGEVEEIFTAPLSLVLDPDAYRVEGRVWRGSWRRYYAVPYGPHYIWGATARILRSLADAVAS
jgi:8-oxo-dGTP pyrophosphatase MutT (NUDIX family)